MTSEAATFLFSALQEEPREHDRTREVAQTFHEPTT